MQMETSYFPNRNTINPDTIRLNNLESEMRNCIWIRNRDQHKGTLSTSPLPFLPFPRDYADKFGITDRYETLRDALDSLDTYA